MWRSCWASLRRRCTGGTHCRRLTSHMGLERSGSGGTFGTHSKTYVRTFCSASSTAPDKVPSGSLPVLVPSGPSAQSSSPVGARSSQVVCLWRLSELGSAVMASPTMTSDFGTPTGFKESDPSAASATRWTTPRRWRPTSCAGRTSTAMRDGKRSAPSRIAGSPLSSSHRRQGRESPRI